MLNSNNKGIVSQVQREVMNFPIQGSGADLTKLAMRDVYAYITANKLEDKVKMLLQIHDELVFEVTLSEKDRQIHIEKCKNNGKCRARDIIYCTIRGRFSCIKKLGKMTKV